MKMEMRKYRIEMRRYRTLSAGNWNKRNSEVESEMGKEGGSGGGGGRE